MINFNFSWLPALIKYDPKTSWDNYIETIYEHFTNEFVISKPMYKGEPLVLKKHPIRNGKEATFYHITTEGDDEEAREFDPLRCERIRWPKAIIEADYVGLKIWENTRKNKENILIWLEEKEYLIIIRKNPNYKLFWTAYPVTESHKKKKLRKEYDDYHKAKTAP